MPVTYMTISASDPKTGERRTLWEGHNSRTPEGTDRLIREVKELHPGLVGWLVGHEMPGDARWEDDDEDDRHEPDQQRDWLGDDDLLF